MDAIQELIAGNAKPANPTVAYCVEQVRDLRKNYDDVTAAIGRIRAELGKAEADQLRIEGAHNKAVADLKYWAELAARHRPARTLMVESSILEPDTEEEI